ncbi:organic hydroperoxide resistance protein [Microvirga sp. BSC39]|jgi:Ohr subfamily peroxiredoxin|uniref:organic hydroperoxide resistance protein n=1 Tax=Microvirga sp. BSC39 TaxID=1549810 RepID=UPI0004E8B4FF|nr:organic hydroperoxide resistance protein [Microvirga sp. BSC39]KFG69205.1 organic hydroperoxide resistance protein [Microvirga sp. BSC39]
MTPLYTAHASAQGGREGVAASNDGKLEVRLSTPKELGGGGGEGTNPEQLFAAGYSACFLGALKFVASQNKVALPAETSVEASVGIGKRDDGQGFGLVVELKVNLPGLSQDQATDLLHKADVVCPYSHAIRGNVQVTLSV